MPLFRRKMVKRTSHAWQVQFYICFLLFWHLKWKEIPKFGWTSGPMPLHTVEEFFFYRSHMVHSFHVDHIVGTRWDPVLITARLVHTTGNSLLSSWLDFHDQDGWMDERCFRPLFCTIKAELGRGWMDGWMNGVLGHFELGRGQPGLMRWSWDETLPQCSISRPGITRLSCKHEQTARKWR